MEQSAAKFLDYLLTVPNLLVVASVYVILGTIHKVFPKVKAHSVWARFAPAAPLVLCSAGVWIPGVADGMSPGMKIMLGIILGALAANGHKLFHQTALGRDDRIANGKAAKKARKAEKK